MKAQVTPGFSDRGSTSQPFNFLLLCWRSTWAELWWSDSSSKPPLMHAPYCFPSCGFFKTNSSEYKHLCSHRWPEQMTLNEPCLIWACPWRSVSPMFDVRPLSLLRPCSRLHIVVVSSPKTLPRCRRVRGSWSSTPCRGPTAPTFSSSPTTPSFTTHPQFSTVSQRHRRPLRWRLFSKGLLLHSKLSGVGWCSSTAFTCGLKRALTNDHLLILHVSQFRVSALYRV